MDELSELETKALAGDHAAQLECTSKGIVLRCPKCHRRVHVHGPEDWSPTFNNPDSGGDPYEFYCDCGLVFYSKEPEYQEALLLWNTRSSTIS